MNNKELSIIIPIYNEEHSIDELYKASFYFNKIVYAGSSDDLFDEESPMMKSYKYHQPEYVLNNLDLQYVLYLCSQ